MEAKLASLPSTNLAKRVEFSYDWQGRRIRKLVKNSSLQVLSDTRFIYDGWNLVAELNSDLSLKTSYAWGLDLSGSIQGAGGVGGLLFAVYNSPSTEVYFPAYDGNGNIMVLCKGSDATWAAQYEYGPFGEVIRATGPMAKANPFRFSTKYLDDETDLLYYGYRYYNAATGRWLSRDPIAERGGLNLYGFVHNNPQSYVDSDGRFFNPVGGLISIGMGWGIAALTGDDYSVGEAVLDFTVGSLGPGLIKKGFDLYKTCKKVRVQAKLATTAVKRLRSVIDPADVANTREFVDKAIRAEWSLRVGMENQVFEAAGIAAWQGVKAIAKSEIKNHTDTVDRLNVTIDQTIHSDGRTDTKIDIQTTQQDFPPDFPWPPIETPGPFPPIELPRN